MLSLIHIFVAEELNPELKMIVKTVPKDLGTGDTLGTWFKSIQQMFVQIRMWFLRILLTQLQNGRFEVKVDRLSSTNHASKKWKA